ncbi:alginate export family protein [Parasphingopyxis lamellibrachiae]|uniref:Alginate export protein n=1 Tax=Parasphingopyxis lamellibrachiae TaxID=680125 RepID=A0A3D9FF10_9SPHN|nr:alginate export family protein [Parasphingopyxis lamellibrachiae]RED16313.1 alginate export protein [Parasphingopyxis lamellibrachiae]
MKKRFLTRLLIIAPLCGFPAIAGATETDTAEEAPPIIDPYVDFRYRLELVDQDGFANDATASTLRIRAGVRTREWNGLSAHVQAEGIVHLGPEDFNDTVNGRGAFPVVADPEDLLLNQAYIRWQLPDRVDARVGRQVINIDNQRWIGSVGWRQNDQTFDAAFATAHPSPATSITYGYAWRVNRIFGPDSPQGIWRDNDIHMIRGSLDVENVGTISAYGYLLDIPDAPVNSSRTWGLRLTGQQPAGGDITLTYAAEYARQSDHAGHPRDFSLSYLLLQPGITAGPVALRLGYERLGGNGVDALQTPLATLHAFNGWSDKFLRTPPNGLRDLYADATIRPFRSGFLQNSAFRIAYHDFRSTRADMHYGREWNAQFTVPLRPGWSVAVKYADYDADRFATDTRKFWLTTQISF